MKIHSYFLFDTIFLLISDYIHIALVLMEIANILEGWKKVANSRVVVRLTVKLLYIIQWTELTKSCLPEYTSQNVVKMMKYSNKQWLYLLGFTKNKLKQIHALQTQIYEFFSYLDFIETVFYHAKNSG